MVSGAEDIADARSRPRNRAGRLGAQFSRSKVPSFEAHSNCYKGRAAARSALLARCDLLRVCACLTRARALTRSSSPQAFRRRRISLAHPLLLQRFVDPEELLLLL